MLQRGENMFSEMRIEQIHSICKRDDEEMGLEDEDELVGVNEIEDRNGTNEIVKIFNQKGVIRFEKPNVNAFRQCGHQCLWESCYQNKGKTTILKSVVCRTFFNNSVSKITTIIFAIKKTFPEYNQIAPEAIFSSFLHLQL